VKKEPVCPFHMYTPNCSGVKWIPCDVCSGKFIFYFLIYNCHSRFCFFSLETWQFLVLLSENNYLFVHWNIFCGVHVCELILLLPTFWIFVSEILNFLACIAVNHFIGVINQHYKFSDPIWKMWHMIYCNIEGSLSLQDRLFFFGYTCYCSANHVMFCFCTVLFNSACCSLALRTDVQDKSTHLNTKFKEEISSYI
jgi:hypothetical protein